MKLPRYVELVRVSSRGQAEKDTPADQRKALDALRRSRPGALVERVEQQVSGAAAGSERPDLVRLHELAAAGAFDEVRVRHLDRLTRHEDPLERAAVLSMVRRAGAVIVDAGGSVLDPATMGGELTWVFSTLASAEERRKIAERTMAGKKRLAAEGRLVNSTSPWGRAFDKESGRWTLTSAAEHYRRLFDLALAGKTLWEIARTLDAEGIVSAKGKAWTAGMVANHLRYPHAAGIYRSHGSATRIPAIVSAEAQREAIRIVAAHDNAGGAHVTHPALLRKILVCGVCGGPCTTNKSTGGEPYYHCAARDPKCYRPHNIAAADDAAWSRVVAWIKSRGTHAAAEAPEEEDLESEVKAAEKGMRTVEQKEEKLGRALLSGAITEATHRKLAQEVARLRAGAQERLDHARGRVESAERRQEAAASLQATIARMRHGIDRADFTGRRELMLTLFRRADGHAVVIWPDGRIRLRGAVPLDASGEEAIRKAGNASRISRITWNIHAETRSA